MIDLAIIMPVYNEEKLVEATILNWIKLLRSLNISFHYHIYDDGSTDSSIEILQLLKTKPLWTESPEVQKHGLKVLLFNQEVYCKTKIRYSFRVRS